MTLLFPLLALVGVGFWYLIWQAFVRPVVSSIPGPFWAKFSNLPLAWLGQQHKIGRDTISQHAKYGPVVRIGPNTVSVHDPRLVDVIYGISPDYPKDHEQMAVWRSQMNGKMLPSLLASATKEEHSKMKRPIANAYSMTNMSTMEGYVDQTIAHLLRRFDEEFINKKRPCDIHNWLQYYAYDVIGEVTFSRDLGFLDAGSDVNNMLVDLQKILDYRLVFQMIPWADWLIRRNSLLQRLRKLTSTFVVHAKSKIMDRVKNGKPDSRRDLLSHFLEAQKAHPEVIDEATLSSHIMTPLMAGSDTTALGLRAVVYYVLRDPRVLATLRAELEENKVPLPPSWKQSQTLPYLDAVIRESLRMHPVSLGHLMRVVPAGPGLEIPDTKIVLPPGTKVGMSIGAISQDKSVFGSDADVFRPERWLQAADETDEAYKIRLGVMNHADMTFSRGSRSCIGKNIAKMEMYKLVPVLLGLLDMEFVDPAKEWTVVSGIILKQSGMDMYLRWREGCGLSSLSVAAE